MLGHAPKRRPRTSIASNNNCRFISTLVGTKTDYLIRLNRLCQHHWHSLDILPEFKSLMESHPIRLERIVLYSYRIHILTYMYFGEYIKKIFFHISKMFRIWRPGRLARYGCGCASDCHSAIPGHFRHPCHKHRLQ